MVLIIPLFLLLLIIFLPKKDNFFILQSPLIASKNIFNLVYPTSILPTSKPKVSIVPTPTPSLVVVMTFYGFIDNDPPGKEIAFPQSHFPNTLHRSAGGVGSFSDPITIAVKKDRFLPGTKMYIPILKKYGIVEDICANCATNQIDVWMNSDDNNKTALINCERKLTKASTGIELTPLSTRPVLLTPFFDYKAGKCL